jgi:hypothetical protein
MKMEQSVSKRRHIKFRSRRITQKKTYNILNTAKIWNQEYLIFSNTKIYLKCYNLNSGVKKNSFYLPHCHTLSHYIAYVRTCAPTFRDYISVPFSSGKQSKKNDECLTLEREGTTTRRTPGTPPPRHGVKSQMIRNLVAELPREEWIWKPSCSSFCFCHSYLYDSFLRFVVSCIFKIDKMR